MIESADTLPFLILISPIILIIIEMMYKPELKSIRKKIKRKKLIKNLKQEIEIEINKILEKVDGTLSIDQIHCRLRFKKGYLYKCNRLIKLIGIDEYYDNFIVPLLHKTKRYDSQYEMFNSR